MPLTMHTIIPTDPELKAKAFYEAMFPEWNFHFQGPNEFWEITDKGTEPKDNRLFVAMIAGGQAPAQPMNYYAVDNIDSSIERCQELGGTIVTPKTATPGVGWFAGCLDVIGQHFGFWEDDRDAK